MQFEWIETERLRMRPFVDADAKGLHALWIEPDVRRYLWDDRVIDAATAAEAIGASQACFAEHGFGLCLILPRDDETLLGFCGFRMFEDPDDGGREKPELMYGLAPPHWGRGYAYEASVAMLRFGFEECGIDPIHAGIDPPNTRSRRVLERLGMTGWRRIIDHGGLPADYAMLARADFQLQPGRSDDLAYRLIQRQE